MTDPLLALILAMTLGLLDRSESVRSKLVVDEDSHLRRGVSASPLVLCKQRNIQGISPYSGQNPEANNSK
jgi:hypothetical protein